MRKVVAALLLYVLPLYTVPAWAQQAVKMTGTVNLKGNIVIGVGNAAPATANYYISPATGTPTAPCVNGSDANNGTAAATPFATWAHAIVAVRGSGLLGSQPLTIVFCGGTYYDTSVAFASADSGSAANPVVYTNYPGHAVIISGGKQLSGSVSFVGPTSTGRCSGVSNCYVATLSSQYAGTTCNTTTACYFERLWYNGQPRVRPRTGVVSSATILGQFGGYPSTQPGAPSFAYNAADPGMSTANTWTNLNDIEVWDHERWTVNIHRISSINTTTHQMTTTCNTAQTGGPGGCPNAGGGGAWRSGNAYQFDNVPQAFGATSGQWYVDRLCGGCASAPLLYYSANGGENPNTDSPGIVVGQNNQAIAFNSASWITIQGGNGGGSLTIQNDNYSVPNGVHGGYSETQLDPTLNYAGTNSANLSSALIGCYGGSHLTFNLLTITQTTLAGIEFVNGCNNFTFQNSVIVDTGGSGIKIGNATTSGTAPSNGLITNSVIRGTGRFINGTDGIALGVANNIEISFNTISQAYHGAIEVCKPGVGNAHGLGICSSNMHDINMHDNDMFFIGEGVTSDLGCIYTMNDSSTGGTANIKATHNRCHDANDEGARFLVNSAYSGDSTPANCFYHDQGSANTFDTQNLSYRCSGSGYKITNGPQFAGQPNTATNNIYAFIMTGVVNMQKCTPSTSFQQFIFTNNVVYMDLKPQTQPFGNGTLYKLQGGVPPIFGATPTSIQNWANNTYFLTTSGGYCNSGSCTGTVNPLFTSSNSGTSCTQTGLSNFAAWQALPEDSGSTVTTTPGFTAPAGCTPASANWPYPTPGVCDDFSFVGHVPGDVILGGKFTVFSVVNATSSTIGNGFGYYGGANFPTVPTTAPDTFRTSRYPASDF